MKAILVIDMPKSCDECPLLRYSNLMKVCTPMNKAIDEVECPLKTIPNEACEILVQGLDAMEKMKSVEVRVVRRVE